MSYIPHELCSSFHLGEGEYIILGFILKLHEKAFFMLHENAFSL